MIDNFALGLTHGLMLLAAWRLLSRPDLDRDDVEPPPAGAKAAESWSSLGPRGDA